MRKKILSAAILLAVATAAYAANYYSGRRYLFGQYFSSILPLFVFTVLSAAVLLIGRPCVCLPLCAIAGTVTCVFTEEYFLILPLPLLLCAHSALVSHNKKTGKLFWVCALLSGTSIIPWFIKLYRGFSLSQYSLAENLPPLAIFFKAVCATVCFFFIFCFFNSFSFVQKKQKTGKNKTNKAGSGEGFARESYNTFFLLCSAALLRGCVYLFVFGNKWASSTSFFAFAAFILALYYDGDPLLHSFAGKAMSVFE
ncbi:MAG: hypothetical protein IJK89_07440 [Clostridia bacterium]|nr:hypothetical protein [Clostridia bacterium]